MAVRFAIASGNWSDTAIWDNGALPQPGDDVYTNGFTIAIDQNITVASLNNGSSPVTVPNIATSKMTGNQFPGDVGYAFSTSGEFSSLYQAFNAFDQSADTSWISVSRNGGNLGYKFVSSKIIKRYSIQVSPINTVDRPFSWNFQGSNDGSTWTTLDTVTSTAIGAGLKYVSTLLANTTPYTWYRLNVTATESAAYEVRIVELGMTESVLASFAVNTGGSFTLAGSYTINANLISTAGTLLSYTASSPTSSTINGYVSVRQLSSTVQTYGILHTGTGILVINGNVYNTQGIGTQNAYGVYCGTNNGTVNLNGNLIANSYGNRLDYVFYIASNFTVNIVGDVVTYGNITTYSGGVALWITAVSTINIIGDVYGSNVGGNFNLGYTTNAINCSAAANINITGNVYGPSGSPAGTAVLGYYTAITISASASLTIIGNIVGSGSFGQGIYTTSTPTINITGKILGSGYPVLYMNGTGGSVSVVGVIAAGAAVGVLVTNVAISSTMSGPFINSATGIMAVSAPKLLLTGSPTRWYLTNSVGGDRTLYSSDFAPGYPDIQDVRSGVSYNGGTMTGTMVVPPASSVASGVPVGSTTGTAFITSAQVGQAVWDYLIANIADPNSIGYRLKDASTVTTTGSQIQALNGL